MTRKFKIGDLVRLNENEKSNTVVRDRDYRVRGLEETPGNPEFHGVYLEGLEGWWYHRRFHLSPNDPSHISRILPQEGILFGEPYVAPMTPSVRVERNVVSFIKELRQLLMAKSQTSVSLRAAKDFAEWIEANAEVLPNGSINFKCQK